MPLDDRAYARGSHPPACTCVDCTRKRLEQFRKTAKKAKRQKASFSYSSGYSRHYSDKPQSKVRISSNRFLMGVAKLLLCLLVIAGIVITAWTGYRLFTHQIAPVIGTIVFLAEIGFLIWIILVLRSSRFRWRKPSFNLVFWPLVAIIVVCAFAGVQPLSGYKDSIFNSISTAPILRDKILNPNWWGGTDQESITNRSNALYELTNSERAKYGLPSLKRSPLLDELAQEKAKSMHDNGETTYISHSGFEQRAAIANSAGFLLVAENIAYGGFEASSFIDMWMNSPGHRANILDPNMTSIGIGVYGKYAVQLFGG